MWLNIVMRQEQGFSSTYADRKAFIDSNFIKNSDIKKMAGNTKEQPGERGKGAKEFLGILLFFLENKGKK